MSKQKTKNILDDCPICGGKHCISCDSDFAFSDMWYEGECVVSNLHCILCNTEIELRIPSGKTTEVKGATE